MTTEESQELQELRTVEDYILTVTDVLGTQKHPDENQPDRETLIRKVAWALLEHLEAVLANNRKNHQEFQEELIDILFYLFHWMGLYVRYSNLLEDLSLLNIRLSLHSLAQMDRKAFVERYIDPHGWYWVPATLPIETVHWLHAWADSFKKGRAPRLVVTHWYLAVTSVAAWVIETKGDPDVIFRIKFRKNMSRPVGYGRKES